MREGVGCGVTKVLDEYSFHVLLFELESDAAELIAHPWALVSCQSLGTRRKCGLTHRRMRYFLSAGRCSRLLHYCEPRKPHLLQVGHRSSKPLPERRTECRTRLVEGKCLESILYFVRDLRVGETPRKDELAYTSCYTGESNGEEGTYCLVEPCTPKTGAGGIPRFPTVSQTPRALILICVWPSSQVSRV